MNIAPYLSFNGECAAAFDFYAQALGGTITMKMTYGESPIAEQMGPAAKDMIMHERLVAGSTMLMGSDATTTPSGAKQGFTVSIMTDDVAEAHRLFGALADGGAVQMAMQETFWSPAFGMLVDRFGTPWMVNCEISAAGTP